MSDVIKASTAPKPVGTYPHARRVGNLLFLSGIGPRDPATNAIAGNEYASDGSLRSYDIAAEMLRLLGVRSVDLITNNPLKIAGLVEEGIPVRRRIPSRTEHNPHNVDYLRTKRERTGHLIELFAEDDDTEAKVG